MLLNKGLKLHFRKKKRPMQISNKNTFEKKKNKNEY